MSLPYRQVHLDFHTSEDIPGVGSRFSKKNFREALTVGHVNSITLFAKCHHGWAYFPSKVNRPHPTLTRNLLGEQLAVCHKLGVRTEVYISAGFDEKYARAHPEHLQVNKDGGRGSFLRPGYHRLCFGTPYLDQLSAEVREVLTRFGDRMDGLFLDIVGISRCYCQHCIAGMREAGLDPNDDGDAREYARRVYFRYTETIARIVEELCPGMPIIHNDGGAIFQGRDIAYCNTGHLELESLPTGGWGYDHFPRAAAYARTLGREYLGMTGKFHRSWGEFGGYKHRNALFYETALANACGARCSIGDQLHPDGEMDMATYATIGAVYEVVESCEPYLVDAVSVADIGLIAAETCGLRCADGSWDQDIGANRILLETHYLYNILDFEADFSQYKLLILPDTITIDASRRAKLEAYLAGGGKLLLTGRSGTDGDENFAFDFGLKFEGEAKFRPSYLRSHRYVEPIEASVWQKYGIPTHVMYSTSYNATATEAFKGDVLAERVDPYFNRTAEHFCSHRHTPYDRNAATPNCYLTEQIAYIGWDIFSEYAREGAIHLRDFVSAAIRSLLPRHLQTLCTDMPSCGVTTLFRQGERLIQHLVYAVPKRRGNGIEVIEDLPTVEVKCSLYLPKPPKRIYLAPTGEDVICSVSPNPTPHGYLVTYLIPRLTCAELVVIE